MPSSLTDASRRWVVIADRHPGLDSTAIFKLTVFAEKVKVQSHEGGSELLILGRPR